MKQYYIEKRSKSIYDSYFPCASCCIVLAHNEEDALKKSIIIFDRTFDPQIHKILVRLDKSS